MQYPLPGIPCYLLLYCVCYCLALKFFPSSSPWGYMCWHWNTVGRKTKTFFLLLLLLLLLLPFFSSFDRVPCGMVDPLPNLTQKWGSHLWDGWIPLRFWHDQTLKESNFSSLLGAYYSTLEGWFNFTQMCAVPHTRRMGKWEWQYRFEVGEIASLIRLFVFSWTFRNFLVKVSTVYQFC